MKGSKTKGSNGKKKKIGLIRRSMKARIVLIYLLVNYVVLATSFGAINILASRSFTADSNMIYTTLSEKSVAEIDGWLMAQGQIVFEVVDSIISQGELDKNRILSYLQQKMESNPYTTDVYMGFADKSFLDGSGWQPDADYDCTTRGWYQGAVSADGLYYGSPYFDLATKQMVIFISRPVVLDGKLVGVVSMDVNLNTLNEILQNTIEVKDSYAFLVDSQDNVIMHIEPEYVPQEDKVTNLKDILPVSSEKLQKSVEKGELVKVKDYDGAARQFALTTIKTTGWKFGIAISDIVFTKSSREMAVLFVVLLIIELVFTSLVSLWTGGMISRPIVALTAVIKKQAELDFRDDAKVGYLNYKKRKDEIGVMTNSLESMGEHVRSLLVATTEVVEQVSTTAEELSATSKQSSTAAQEVAQTIYEIARGAAEQAASTESSTRSLMELGEIIDEDKASIGKLLGEHEHVETLVGRGLKTVNTLTEKSKANSEAIGIVDQSMQKTYTSSEKISEASNFISSVASQTNLLALNAAIEAARAGEQGKGFAVVASEIGKLAEQSAKSSADINEILHTLLEDMSTAVDKMKEAERIGQEQSENVDLTERSFHEIAAAIDNAKKAVQGLAQSSNMIKERKDEVFDTVQNLSAIAEENAASSQEASASTQEETASMEEIANLSSNLASITMELQGMVSRFKV